MIDRRVEAPCGRDFGGSVEAQAAILMVEDNSHDMRRKLT
jgi:hypothetical protein